MEALVISAAQADQLLAAKNRREELRSFLTRPHPAHSTEGRELDASFWPAVLSHISSRVSHGTFDLWFAETRMVDDDGTTITVESMSPDWLKRVYADVLIEAVTARGRPEATVKLVPPSTWASWADSATPE